MNSAASPGTETDLRAYLRPIWRRKWVVLLVAIVAAGGAYAFSKTQAKTYQTTTHVYVENANPTAVLTPGAVSAGPPTAQQLQDIATLFTAQSVTAAVSRSLGMPVPAAGSVNIAPEANSSFITVTASSHSPTLAARLANSYVRVFLTQQRSQIVKQVRQARLAAESQLAALPRHGGDPNVSAERQTLLGQISSLQSIELDPAPSAQQIDTALPPSAPASPKPLQDGLIGLAVGLIVGLLIVYGLEMFDNRILSSEAIHEAFSKPVLAVLPHVKDPAPVVRGAAVVPSPFLEPLRMLRLQLDLVDERPSLSRDANVRPGEGSGRVVAVTSGRAGEGKSTTSRGLALAFAESGARVLLVDADLRRPSLDRLLNSRSQPGLVHVLAGQSELADAVSAVATFDPPEALPTGSAGGAFRRGTVDLLAHGTGVADPVSLLGSARMRDFVDTVRREYDVVVLDTTPVLAVGDAVPLLRQADLALLVVRFGYSTRHSATATGELLGRLADINVAGVVINDIRRSGSSGYGAYGGYAYGGYEGMSTGQPVEKPEANVPV